MNYRIKDIQANPFRHIDRYPIRQDKVAALRESLRTTGFWDNVVARIGPDGKPQIAYGHHRLFALREEYKPNHEVTLIVRDLSDEQMLKIMARENLEEWGHSAAIEHETVRAVVEAYADGRVALPSPHAKAIKAQVRYAPGFIMGQGPDGIRIQDLPYTAESVAEFLAWQIDKVGYALGALELIEEGLLSESAFDGLGTAAARRIVEETRKAKREREIREREQRQEAERARKAAAEAQRRRDQAQEERKKHEERARRTREERERLLRQAEANRAKADAEQAERERQAAERRQREAEKRAEQEHQRARERAKEAGRQASEGLKSGKGYADPNLVVREKGRDRKPPEIDEFAFTLAARLNKILDPDFDERGRDLDRVLTYRRHLGELARRELDIVLSRIVERIVAARKKLDVDPRNGDVIDAEVIDRKAITR